MIVSIIRINILNDLKMANIIFAIPLELSIATWSVIFIASLSFIVMFGLASAMGDFQGLIKTTLENDLKMNAFRDEINMFLNVKHALYESLERKSG